MHHRLLWIIFALPLIGFGCSIRLAPPDAGGFLRVAAEKVKNAVSAQTSRLIENAGDNFVKNLTDAQKQAIDEWLSGNNLNKFGDPLGTIYAGGTPLFDEKAGLTMDRFHLLFQKFPNLRDIVSNQIEEMNSGGIGSSSQQSN